MAATYFRAERRMARSGPTNVPLGSRLSIRSEARRLITNNTSLRRNLMNRMQIATRWPASKVILISWAHGVNLRYRYDTMLRRQSIPSIALALSQVLLPLRRRASSVHSHSRLP